MFRWRPLVLAIVIAIALTIWLRFDSQVHSRTHIQGICTILSCKIFAIKEDKTSRLTESAQLFEPCRLMLFMNRETTMSSTTNSKCQQNQTISMWCALHISLFYRCPEISVHCQEGKKYSGVKMRCLCFRLYPNSHICTHCCYLMQESRCGACVVLVGILWATEALPLEVSLFDHLMKGIQLMQSPWFDFFYQSFFILC